MKITERTLKIQALTDRLHDHAKNVIKGGVAGLAWDNFLYGLAHKIPQLTTSTGFKIPYYATDGIHFDDVIAQSTALALIVYGGIEFKRTKNPKKMVAGAAMAIAQIWTSQYQYGPL